MDIELQKHRRLSRTFKRYVEPCFNQHLAILTGSVEGAAEQCEAREPLREKRSGTQTYAVSLCPKASDVDGRVSHLVLDVVWSCLKSLQVARIATGAQIRASTSRMEKSLRVFILQANPAGPSFGAALLKQSADALRSRGHEIDDCDLHAEA
jgi:hypothetical protein